MNSRFAEKIGRMSAESVFASELDEMAVGSDYRRLILECYRDCCALIDSEQAYAASHDDADRDLWIASQRAFGNTCRNLYDEARAQLVPDLVVDAVRRAVLRTGWNATHASVVLDSLLGIADVIRPRKRDTTGWLTVGKAAKKADVKPSVISKACEPGQLDFEGNRRARLICPKSLALWMKLRELKAAEAPPPAKPPKWKCAPCKKEFVSKPPSGRCPECCHEVFELKSQVAKLPETKRN